jgi:hypothetical protein
MSIEVPMDPNETSPQVYDSNPSIFLMSMSEEEPVLWWMEELDIWIETVVSFLILAETGGRAVLLWAIESLLVMYLWVWEVDRGRSAVASPSFIIS